MDRGTDSSAGLTVIAAVVAALSCTSTHVLHKDDLLRQIDERGIPVEVLQCFEDNKCAVRVGDKVGVSKRRGYLNRLLRNRPHGHEAGARWVTLRGMGYLDCLNGKNERVRIGVNESSQLVLHDAQGKETRFYLMSGAYDGQQLVGLRSVWLGIPRSIDISVINTVELYSEFKKEWKVEPNTGDVGR